jgi:uncharacterized ion transporter superfamily protein YfcC
VAINSRCPQQLIPFSFLSRFYIKKITKNKKKKTVHKKKKKKKKKNQKTNSTNVFATSLEP